MVYASQQNTVSNDESKENNIYKQLFFYLFLIFKEMGFLNAQYKKRKCDGL